MAHRRRRHHRPAQQRYLALAETIALGFAAAAALVLVYFAMLKP